MGDLTGMNTGDLTSMVINKQMGPPLPKNSSPLGILRVKLTGHQQALEDTMLISMFWLNASNQIRA